MLQYYLQEENLYPFGRTSARCGSIGCILTIDLDHIRVNIAMQTFFDSMHVAFQKNISSIKQNADINFQFFCQLILVY
ncbi:transposase [Wolbachia endosymbiont of Armadillidium vulgare str. wVulC]|nr:transposase [Wolbachia endosymbiont of Armadillidium vulgare str. wVulC]